jgi:hypothetical protein
MLERDRAEAFGEHIAELNNSLHAWLSKMYSASIVESLANLMTGSIQNNLIHIHD